jgi:hypothetical protein
MMTEFSDAWLAAALVLGGCALIVLLAMLVKATRLP